MPGEAITIDAGSSGQAAASVTHGKSLLRIGGTVPPDALAGALASPQLAAWLQTSLPPVHLDLVGLVALVPAQLDAAWRSLLAVLQGRRLAVSVPSRAFDQLSSLLPGYVSSAAAQGVTVRFFAPGAPGLEGWLAQPASSPLAPSSKKGLLVAGAVVAAALVASIFHARSTEAELWAAATTQDGVAAYLSLGSDDSLRYTLFTPLREHYADLKKRTAPVDPPQ